MAAVNTMASQRFLALSNPKSTLTKSKPFIHPPSSSIRMTAGVRRPRQSLVEVSVTGEFDAIPVKSGDSADQQVGVAPEDSRWREEEESGIDQPGPSASPISGFAFESVSGGGGGGGLGFSTSSSPPVSPMDGEDTDKFVDRAINASIVLAAGTFAITKLLTIDRDYWHKSRSFPARQL